MFGFGKKLRKDLPPINITKKQVPMLLFGTKLVPRSKREQRELKRELEKQYTDRYFVDDLKEWNSISPLDASLDWIDKIEMMDALLGDWGKNHMKMEWEDFYEKFYDWSESTQDSRLSALGSFGDPDEVIEIVWEYARDQAVVRRFMNKAVDAGVKFDASQIMDIIYERPPDCQRKLVLAYEGVFSKDNIEELQYELDEDTVEVITERALKAGIESDNDERYEDSEEVISTIKKTSFKDVREEKKRRKKEFWDGVAQEEFFMDFMRDLFKKKWGKDKCL